MNIEKQFSTFNEMMENMSAEERELFSGKLLNYLLFSTIDTREKKDVKKSGLTPEEMKLIKALAKKTEELKNLLGENPDLFM